MRTEASELRVELHADDPWLVHHAGEVVEVDPALDDLGIQNVPPEQGDLVLAAVPAVAQAQPELQAVTVELLRLVKEEALVAGVRPVERAEEPPVERVGLEVEDAGEDPLRCE